MDIMTGIASATAVFDMAGAITNIKNKSEIAQAVLDIQRSALETQRALGEAEVRHAADQRHVKELEAVIEGHRHWEAEKAKYDLADTGDGSYAYKIRSESNSSTATRWYCPHCWESGRKSVMKKERITNGRGETLVCHPCGLDIIVSGRRNAPPAIASSRGMSTPRTPR